MAETMIRNRKLAPRRTPRVTFPPILVEERRWHGSGGLARLGGERSKMPDQESEIERLESEFPLVSGLAFATARARVLASGQSVLQAEGGFIYEVFPDGRRRRVKQIEPPTPVVPGTKITFW